jgi:hypothetical protein
LFFWPLGRKIFIALFARLKNLFHPVSWAEKCVICTKSFLTLIYKEKWHWIMNNNNRTDRLSIIIIQLYSSSRSSACRYPRSCW